MTCEQLQHGYELYVFGTLEPEERPTVGAEIEAHLTRGCTTCAAGVAQARELAAHLAMTVPPAEPPARLRAEILKAAAGLRHAEPPLERVSPGKLAFWKWAFAAGAIAAIALLIVAAGLFQQGRSLEAELQSSQTGARILQERERELLQRLGAFREAMRLMTAPEAREVRFGPQQPSGRIFLQPGGLVLLASDFPPPPPGRIYALWLIAAGRPAPIPAGVFEPDAEGNAFHLWKQPIEVASLQAIAVSDEPPGGVPAPTGQILLTVPLQ